MLVKEISQLTNVGVIFVFTIVVVYLLSKFASKLELIDLPGEHRQHRIATPMIGGIAIYLSLLLGLLVVDSSYWSLLPSLFLMCAVGALDDRSTLPSWLRFFAQALAAYLMIAFTDVLLFDLGYQFSASTRILLGEPWSTVMTIFSCIGVVNAINMSDGLDGLAGCLTLIVLITLMFFGHPASGLILVSIGAVAGFLFWNIRVVRKQASVFMGDAGSTMLGLILAFLLIQSSQLEQGILPVTALWLLSLPLIDAVAVLIVRPMRGRSPFSADRIHYHHQLLDRGISVNVVLLIIIAFQCLFVAIGITLLRIGVAEHIQLALFLSIFFMYVVRLYYFSGKPAKTT